jgi:hypothetical protein
MPATETAATGPDPRPTLAQAHAHECRCDLSHGRRHTAACDAVWDVLTDPQLNARIETSAERATYGDEWTCRDCQQPGLHATHDAIYTGAMADTLRWTNAVDEEW